MKKFITALVVAAFCTGAGLCCAAEEIPSMVGTWQIVSEGGVLAKNGVIAPTTHHSGDFSNLTAEYTVTKQKGRVFHGVFTGPKGSKPIIGVIGMDNQTLFSSDQDGFAEGKFVSKDKIHIVYRHSNSYDFVVAVGSWTRKK